MDTFRTEIFLKKSPLQINYNTPLLFTGSCFSKNLGNHLLQRKFPVLINPFGVIYNPASISKGLHRLINSSPYTENDLHQHHNLWYSFDHHGSFSHPDKGKALETINKGLNNASAYLQSAKFLFITFGTAWVYEKKADKQVVANCHKLPSGTFNRYLLKPEDIISEYLDLINQLLEYNNDLQIFFTVSPVRHLSDGAVENQRSKAILLYAIHEIMENTAKTHYFPAYELVMDDLRDYRFYEENLTHPGKQAVDYIFRKFMDAFMNEDVKHQATEIHRFMNGFAHRPHHIIPPEIEKYLQQMKKKAHVIEKKYPPLNFDKELIELTEKFNHFMQND